MAAGTQARTRTTRIHRLRFRAELELARAAQKAVALAQQEKSAWTRADLIKYLGRVLPRTGRDPAAAAALLQDLADRALASEFEPVACLEAPEPVEVPASLLRADGRSVYQRHGGTRYATRAQLVMEERMVAQAGADGAPRVTRAQAAQALGADPARLEDALAGRAHDAARREDARDAQDTRTGSGLREDQAAAALAVLADGRLVSVINAPAGAGKTRVLAEAARIWAEAGLGPVIGITPSQSARNTLAAGVPVSYNAAQFLGHLPGRRGARGPVPIGPGTLLVIDEASMLSGPDLADLIAYAKAAAPRSSWPGTSASCRRWKTAAACPCSPRRSATPGWPNLSGSAASGNDKPACGCVTATPRSWPSMTSTAASSAATPSRSWTPPRPPTSPCPRAAPTRC